jgi:hypothetical protein
MTSRTRRFALASLAVVALTVGLVGWAVPTFAGRLFVEIAPHVVPLGGGSASNKAVILADGTSASASRLGIGLDVTNHYPWPVLIGFHGASFQASLYRRDEGASGPVWLATAEDPEIEQSDESPDGASSARVISIPPGTTTFLSAVDGMTLDPSSIGVDPGIYHFRVAAFGIEGPTQLLSIVDGTGSASADPR